MITVGWDDDAEIIIKVDYEAPVESWAEYNNAIAACYDLARSRAYSVYIIHNPGSVPMPSEPGTLGHLRAATRTMPHNVPLCVMCIENIFARRIVSVVLKLLEQEAYRFRFAASLSDAYQLIHLHQTESTT